MIVVKQYTNHTLYFLNKYTECYAFSDNQSPYDEYWKNKKKQFNTETTITGA